MNARRVLVTGANGQLARPIVDFLRRDGFEPLLLARNDFKHDPKWRTVIVRDQWTCEGIARLIHSEAIDAIVNLAGAGIRPGGTDFGTLFEANVALPARLLKAGSKRVRAFINIGSGAEYAGVQSVQLAEDAVLGLTHPYGLSKAAGGLASKQVADDIGIAFAHLRLFGVYGEHEAAHRLLPSLLARLPRGVPAPMSDGLQVRDWLYEEDVGAAVSTALGRLLDGHMPGGIYNLGSGEGVTVRRFAETVAALLQAPASLLQFGAIDRRSRETNVLVADPRSFQAATDWRPAHSLDTGLSIAIDRFRATSGEPTEGSFDAEEGS